MVVADVAERHRERAEDREDPGGEEAAVDRRHRRLVLVAGAHREDTDDRREHADRTRDNREDQPDHRVGSDRVERGDAEDDRRDQGDLVALEQVGGHTGAVADVVAHVVGDGGGVAGIVFGNARFDLADEVGADVGGLGEDAAADAEEQREERAAETETDEDRGRGVLEHHDDQGGAEQAETDGEHAGDAARAERDLERSRERARLGGRRGAHVAAYREAHADEAGETRHQAAAEEREGAEDAGGDEAQPDRVVTARLVDLGRGHEHDHRERNEDDGDGLELAAEVRHRADLDCLGDLDHLRRAGLGREHPAHEEEPDEQREHGGEG